MRPPSSTRPRVAHARPLTPDARASHAAISFRVAERALRRQRVSRLRLALPIPIVAALAAVLLVAGQPLARASGPTTAPGIRDMDRSVSLGRPTSGLGQLAGSATGAGGRALVAGIS